MRDLSLTIPKGEVFGFIGPNGAGKTTTIKVLATLLKPSFGSVRVKGTDGAFITVREVTHLTVSPTGVTATFDRPTLSCS